MMRNFAGLCLLCAHCLVSNLPAARCDELKDWEAVIGLHARSRTGRRLTEDGQDVPESLELSFSAAGQYHSYSMTKVDPLSPRATVTVNAKGKSTKTVATHDLQAYKGTTAGGWVVAVRSKLGEVRAVINTFGETFYLDPARLHTSSSSKVQAAWAQSANSTVLFKVAKAQDRGAKCKEMSKPKKQGRRLDDDDHGHSHIITSHSHDHTIHGHNTHPVRRQLSTLNTLPTVLTDGTYGRLSGCPTTPKPAVLPMGLIVDHGYYTLVGGWDAVIEDIALILVSTNAIFADQVCSCLTLCCTLVCNMALPVCIMATAAWLGVHKVLTLCDPMYHYVTLGRCRDPSAHPHHQRGRHLAL
jgi:hypothetical protein